MTTTPIGSTLPASGTSPSTMSTSVSTPAKTSSGGTSSLGSDAFLKLLVAQLKYQDPMNPAKGTDFMAQTAQFTMVEKLTEMAKQNDTSLLGQQTLQATQMVGHQVAYMDSLGNPVTGTVSSVKLLSTGPSLVISNQDVALSAVITVGPLATGTGSSANSTQSTATSAAQLALQATEMVGHQVVYTDSTGASATGVVSSVKLLPSGLSLMIGGKSVPVTALTEVQPLAAASIPSTESLLAMLGPTIAAALAAVQHTATSTTPATSTTATDGGSTTSSTATDGVRTSI